VNVWLINAAFVAVAVCVLAVSWVVAMYLRDAAGRWLVRHQVEADAVVLGRRAVYVTLLIAGGLLALAFAFRSQNVAVAGLVTATIVASLGVQDVLKNYVSGYYLLLERHVHVGDTIAFDTHTGVIEDIKLRVSLVRGEDGSLVIVPNSLLFNNAVAIKPRSAPALEPKAAPARRSLRKRPQENPAEGLETV
jgi:small conductance mechanosensitive channel